MFEEPEIKIEKAASHEQEVDIYRQKVFTCLERVGFRETLHEEIINRLTLLERGSEFNEDSRKIERGMENVLNLLETRYAEQYPQLRLSQKQRADARIAAILHDVGKSGPVEATPEEQEMIVKIFASENINDENLLVVDVISEIFDGSQLENVSRALRNCGINEETTMRQFWDKHAYWTHDILEQYSQGLDKQTRIIAGSHHIDHGINPYALPESEVPLAANIIGTLESYIETLEGRALIALDQYEAAIRRGKLSHEAALERLRNNLSKFKEDKLLSIVFDAIDELGKQQAVFS